MIRAMVVAAAATLCVAGGARVDAQGQQPAGFKNLQVFPKDVPRDVVIAAMKNFTRALNVRCPFCHVGEEGAPLEKFDFVSDTKPTKQIARAMMRMTAEINAHVGKAIPDAPSNGYQVTCFTCHRGAEHPQHSPDAAKPPGSEARSDFGSRDSANALTDTAAQSSDRSALPSAPAGTPPQTQRR